MRRLTYALFAVVWSLCFTVTAPAQELPEINQVTTHPSNDDGPAVSPDGIWLAFTSERSGNADIWVRRLPRDRPVQITTHQAEDTHPVWSPDGKSLFFVSKRRDALGDIWRVDLDLKRNGQARGKPVQMTTSLGTEGSPTISPDGRYLIYVSDRDGIPNIWTMEIRTLKERRVTLYGATDPARSPAGDWILFTSFRDRPDGDLYILHVRKPERAGQEETVVYPVTSGPGIDGSGCWSPDGKGFVFVRRDRDTNGDGNLDFKDRASLWTKRLKESESAAINSEEGWEREIQITVEIHEDSDPVWGPEGEILFVSDRGGGWDIWSIPEGGILPRQSSALDQYAKTLDRFGEVVTREGLHQAVLGYQRVQDFFPEDTEWVQRALIQKGEILNLLGLPDRAQASFDGIGVDAEGGTGNAARAELKKTMLASEDVNSRIQQCHRIIETYPEDRSTVAEAWLVLGDLYRDQGNVGESIAAYGRVIQSYPEYHNLRAQAQIRIGSILESEGQEETARQSYLAVLREFGDVPLWRMRAIDRLMNQIQTGSTDPVQGFRQIIQEGSDLPALMAEAQLSIGRWLIDNGDVERAVRELETVEIVVPGLQWAEVESRILRARAYGLMADELRGIKLLQEVLETAGSLDGGVYRVRATEELFKLLFDSAERLKRAGDFALAESRYRKAVELRPDDIQVHRGLIESAVRRGRADELIREYESYTDEAQGNPIRLYALGLIYSYLGERNTVQIERSNGYLLQAMEADYRLIYPYQTLSYNYELLERLAEERARQRAPFFARAGKTILAPLRWLVGLLPFKSRKEPGGYYERAIQALTTAMELNDESQDPRMEALLAQNLANNFFHLGEFGYKRAYSYYRMRISLDTTFTLPLQKAVFYERMGRCGVVLEDAEEATAYLKKAIETYNMLGRNDAVVRNLRMLAFLYHLAGRYEDAIDVYRQTVVRSERAGDWFEAEREFRNIAYNFSLMGEPEDAVQYAHRAEEILNRREISLRPVKKSYLRVEVFGFSIPVWRMEEIGSSSSEGFTEADELALVYGLLSKNYEALKLYDEAVDYEKKRQNIFLRRKDRLAGRISLNRLGHLQYKKGVFGEAWTYFFQAWERCKKREDDWGRWINCLNLGNVAIVELDRLSDQTHTETALDRLEEELQHLAGRERSGLRREKLLLLNTAGSLLTLRTKKRLDSGTSDVESLKETVSALEDLQRAKDFFESGLQLAGESGDRREEAIILKNLGEVYGLAADNEAALDAYQNVYTMLEVMGNVDLLWRVEYAIAHLLAQQLSSDEPKEESERVLNGYRRAMSRMESVSVQEEGSEERLSDRQERSSLYVEAAQEMVRRGFIQEGLETVERGRQKQVADMLARHPPDFKRERHKVVWGNIRYLRTWLGGLQRRLVSLQAAEFGEVQTEAVIDSLFEYRTEFESLMESARQEDKILAYCVGAETIDLATIQRALSNDMGALSYLVGKSGSFIWTVDTDTIRIVPLELTLNALETIVERFRLEVEQTGKISEQIREEMADLLLKPVSDFIESKSTLILALDGVLWNIPFALLSDDRGLLLENNSLVYTPSLTIYGLTMERRKTNVRRILLVGDEQDRMAAGGDSRPIERELIGSEASEDEFKRVMSEVDVVQIERWMNPAEHDPLTASVVLAPGASEDGFLHAEEFFSMDLRPSLVFLPPTRNFGTGNQSTLAFFYGLLYAGVPSMIRPMWPIPSDGKQIFFASLYEGLQRKSTADALADAQLTLKDRTNNDPTWAGFQLIGFAGMDDEERMEFARSNLSSSIRKGRMFEQRGEYTDAMETFKKAQDMAGVIGDTSIVRFIYNEIRRVGVKGGYWEEAASYQRRLQAVYEREGDVQNIQTGLRRLVAYYTRGREFERAAEAKLEYLATLQSASVEQRIAAYEEIAFIYALGRDYNEAIDWADRALEATRDLGDSTAQGRALIRKGRFLLEKDEAWEARTALLEGVALLEKHGRAGDTSLLAELAAGFGLLGLAHENLTRYDEALQAQRESLRLWKRLERPRQEAQAYQYLANVCWKKGDYREGLLNQNKALDAFKDLQDNKLLAMAYSTQGLLYLGLGDLRRAREAEEKGLDLAVIDENLEDEATIWKNVGLVAIQEGDPRVALSAFRRASQIDSTLEFRRGLAYDYRNQGSVLGMMGRSEEGVALILEGLRLSRGVGDLRNEGYCLYELGRAYSAVGERRMALAVLDSGIVVVSDLLIPDLEWRIHRHRAGLLRDMGRDEEALTAFYMAVEIVEGLRAELKVEAFKEGFLDDKMDLYFDLVTHLRKMGRAEQAFDTVERAKSRNFIDLLGNQDLPLARAQGALIQKEKTARQAVLEAQDRLAWFAQRRADLTPGEEAERSAWQDTLENRRSMYADVLVSVQAESPELASFVSVDPWPLPRIQELLTDSTALIEYFNTTEALFIWVVTWDRVTLERIEVSETELQEQIRLLRETIQAHLSVGQESRALYDWLIKPVKDRLNDAITHLVLVPHGPLHYLPFAVLEDADGKALLETFTVSFVPSATVLGYCIEKAAGRSTGSGTESVLALSNPDLGEPRFDLPFAEKEVRAIRRTYEDVDAFFGPEVTEKRVRDEIESRSIIHFACHAEYEMETPLFSALLLSPSEGEDGRLEVHEIFGLPLDCDLVSLSACETGLGQITAGDEIVGLARGFIFAGSPSIVTSLWKVDDLATAVLVKRFYRYLKEGQSKASALRNAQLLVKERVNSDPAAWAAFTLTGEYR